MYSRFVAVLCLSLSLGLVSALPSPDITLQVASVTVPTALASPTSITTTDIVQTPNGTMTETCVLTFTPVGHQVQEVRNCTLAMDGSQASTTLVAPSSTAVAAAFVMPGTTLQVLPVGLGVYCGITTIAVFAVVVVTLERVHYRKMFRQQRAAESGSFGLWYGGMTKA